MLEITPKLLVYAGRLIQLRHVVSVQLNSVSPSRRIGALLILVGSVILMGVLLMPQALTDTIAAPIDVLGNGVPSLAGLALLGLGLLAYFHSRDVLVIALADGEKVRIPAPDPRFMLQVVDIVRGVLSAPETEATAYIIDLKEQSVERQVAQTLQDEGDGPVAASAPTGGMRAPEAAPAKARANGHVNGAAAHMEADAGPPSGPISQGASKPEPQVAAVARPGIRARLAAVPSATLEQPVARPPLQDDLDRIGTLLQQAEAPHLDQLLRLIDTIKRHLAAQPPRLDEAQQGWDAFSQYALRYLGGIDGLTGEVRRVDARINV